MCWSPLQKGTILPLIFQKVTSPNAYPWLSLYSRHADRGCRCTGAAPGAASWHMYGGSCGPDSVLEYGGRTPPGMERNGLRRDGAPRPVGMLARHPLCDSGNLPSHAGTLYQQAGMGCLYDYSVP